MKKILVIQLRQLGDILVTIPALKALRSTYPESDITFLTHKMGSLIFKEPRDFTHVVYEDTLLSQKNVLKRLWRSRSDTLVVDFMDNPRSALMSLVGGRQRIGFQGNRRLFYNQSLPRPSSGEYLARAKIRVLHEAGILPHMTFEIIPTLDLDDQAQIPWRKFQWPKAQGPKPLKVLLSPTHRRVVRRWPLENYKELARYLLHRGCQVGWIWGPGEKEFVEEAKEAVPGSFLLPPTDFRQLAYFISQSDFFIGNSNGPSHLAVATGCPSLQLHGPTDGRSWCPPSPIHAFLQAPGATIDSLTTPHVIGFLDPILMRLKSKPLDSL